MSKKSEKKSTSKKGIQKDDIVQAVVVTDSFNKNFMPACSCLASLPVVNKKLIDYSLEWLNSSGVDEVILFCSSNVTDIKNYVSTKTNLNVDVKVLISEDCSSLGDVMRALDRYAVIRSNFILLTVDVIGNVNFASALQKLKSIQEKDKGASMMVLCKPVGRQRKDLNNKTFIACNSENRIISYQVQDNKNVDLPMDILLEQDYVEIRNDLLQPGIAICSVAVPPLFSDNFDFQTLDDFIRGLLMNEEILQSTVYYDCVKHNEYLTKVNDWPMYQTVSQDIIRRWTYPMVLDVTEKYTYGKNSTYLKNVTFNKNCKIISDVVIGNKTKLNKNVYVDHSVIGDECVIGDNVRIENSYIFDNVVIDKNCIIKYSVIGEKCHVKQDSILEKNCILSPNIILGKNTKIDNVSLVISTPSKFSENCSVYRKNSISETSDSEDEEILGLVTKKCLPSDEAADDTSSESSSESSLASPVMDDDLKIFYTEVIDSLTRGYEDKLKCENLILEINSSRYAYNVTVNEVNYNLISAILNINSQNAAGDSKQILQHTISKLNYFMPVIKNYIKNNDAQQDCLSAIEDVVGEDNTLLNIVPKILHFLYDKNILNEDEILSWYPKIEACDLKKVLVPFIKWLNEADEESEDESSD